MLEKLHQTPLSLDYNRPSTELIEALKTNNQRCEVTESTKIQVESAYFNMGLPGTEKTLYTRRAVMQRLEKIAECLGPNTGLRIFDIFRTKETQTALYHEFANTVRAQHPDFNDAELHAETLRFVFNPFGDIIPPHNTGGAVDLAIVDLTTNELWDFGTGFDAITDLSNTHFFEQTYDPQYDIDETRWNTIRENRRVLFHLMAQFDFTNYDQEWWHFDLGDHNWAEIFGVDAVFGSMEV